MALPHMFSTVGAVAQLGERVNGIHEVSGSIPLGSTNSPNNLADKSHTLRSADLACGTLAELEEHLNLKCVTAS